MGVHNGSLNFYFNFFLISKKTITFASEIIFHFLESFLIL